MRKSKLLLVALMATLAICGVMALTACDPVSAEKDIFTVTIDGAETLVPKGEKAALPSPENSDPEKVFVGWFIGDTAFDPDTLVNKDLTIVSKWRDKYSYTVKFDAASTVVKEGGKAVRPSPDPTQPDKVFLGWYLGNNLFDFDTVITGDIDLVSKWKNDTKTVTGKIITLHGGTLAGVTVSCGGVTATSGADGTFSLANVKISNTEITFSKTGYESVKKAVVLNADELLTYDAGNVEMTEEFVKFAEFGGTKAAAWEGYFTRAISGISFKFVSESEVASTEAIGIFLYAGEVTGTARNAQSILVQATVAGAINTYNYPSNSKTTINISEKSSIISAVSFSGPETVITVFVPFSFLQAVLPEIEIDALDTYGISLTSDKVSSSTSNYDEWFVNTVEVNRENITTYMRLAAHNVFFIDAGNIDTIITGNAGVAGATVTCGDIETVTDGDGNYTVKFTKKLLSSVDIVISKTNYITKTIQVDLAGKTVNYTATGVLEGEKKNVTVTVLNLETDQPIEGAVVTYNGTNYTTDANGECVVANVNITAELNLSVSADDYRPATDSFAAEQVADNNFAPVVKLTALMSDVKVSVTGRIYDIHGGLDGVTVSAEGTEVSALTNGDGGFTLSGLDFGAHAIIIEKAGYVTQRFEISRSDFLAAGAPDYVYSLSDAEMAQDYVKFADIGGTKASAWEGYFTRDINGLSFKFVSQSDVASTEGIGLFVYPGAVNGGTTRNAQVILIQALMTGVVNTYNYPSNTKATINVSEKDDILSYITSDGGETVISVFIPYSFFNAVLPDMNLDALDTYGISLTADKVPNSTSDFDVWFVGDVKIDRGNPTLYVRLTSRNLFFLDAENIDTIITGNAGVAGATVTMGSMETTTAGDGSYTFKFTRKLLRSASIVISKTNYVTKNIQVDISGAEVNFTAVGALEGEKKSVTVTVLDFETELTIEGAVVTFNGTDYTTDANGQCVILNVNKVAPISLSVSADGYNGDVFAYTDLEVVDGSFAPVLKLVAESSSITVAVTGIVSDILGVLEGVRVSAQGTDASAVTDSSGVFFLELNYGPYTIVFEKDGYVTKTCNVTKDDFLAAGAPDYIVDVTTISLDMEKSSYLGPIGGTNADVFELYMQRTDDGLILYALGQSTLSANARVELYLNEHSFMKSRSLYTWSFHFYADGTFAANNFPVNKVQSQPTTGMSLDVTGNNIIGFVPYSLLKTVCPEDYIVGVDTPFGITFLAVKGSSFDTWQRPDMLGVSGTAEVVRGNAKDYIIFDKDGKPVAEIPQPDGIGWFDELVEKSDAYVNGKTFSENMGSFDVTTFTPNNLAQTTATVTAGGRLFVDRSTHTWDSFRIRAFDGMTYLYRNRGTTATVSVTANAEGYLLLAADCTTATVSIDGAVWKPALLNADNPGYDAGVFFGYYIAYVSAGQVLTLPEEGILMTNNYTPNT